MRETCDKCHTKILEGKCECGIWIETHEKCQTMLDQEKVLIDFSNKNKQDNTLRVISMDHHSGSCMILFMGDYHDCYVIRDYMERMGIGEI